MITAVATATRAQRNNSPNRDFHDLLDIYVVTILANTIKR